MTKHFRHKPLFDLAGNAMFNWNTPSVHGGKGRAAPARRPHASAVSASQGAPDARKITAPLWSRHFERTSRSAFECSSRSSLEALRKGTSDLDASASPVDMGQPASGNLAADDLQLAQRRQLHFQ